jgi:glycosyltransferase involved in cell wall biosynthesis
MQFSKEMNQIGQFRLAKVFELIQVIVRIIRCRFAENVRILYYPPAGPNKMAVLRDLIILTTVRWLFDKTIFHFHAGGVSQAYESMPSILKPLFRTAYFYPDIAIRTSQLAPDDGSILKAKRNFVVPNGIEDAAVPYLAQTKKNSETSLNILYVGLLSESKGLLVLLEACRILARQQFRFHLHCLGVFQSVAFEGTVREFLRINNLNADVTFHGEVSGKQKWDAFSMADIFCFPSHFESETFGLAILEAMSFGLPVIATKWRGIPTLVEDGFSGFLIPIKDSNALARKLERLIRDPVLRRQLGRHGRETFLRNYSIQRHRDKLEEVFQMVG